MCAEFSELPNSSSPAPSGSKSPGAGSPSRTATTVLTPLNVKMTSSSVVGPPSRRLPNAYWPLLLIPQSESMNPYVSPPSGDGSPSWATTTPVCSEPTTMTSLSSGSSVNALKIQRWPSALP